MYRKKIATQPAFPNHIISKLSDIFNNAEGDNCLTSYSGKITLVDKDVQYIGMLVFYFDSSIHNRKIEKRFSNRPQLIFSYI